MRSIFKTLNKIKPSFIPAITWFIISLILLTLPGSAFPKENWFSKIWLDKWIHIGLFAILVVLWSWALLKKIRDNERLKAQFIRIGLACLAYGIGIEFVQKYFIVNRSFDVGDILADGIGCLIGLIFSWKRFIKN